MRLPKGPAGRAAAAMVAVMLLVTVLAVGTGIGYSVSRPLLGDGSAYLARGHTVAHVNGETGKSDAQAAVQLATGTEPVQTVRLPDGRVAIVNKATGTVTMLDGATMTPTGAPVPNPGAGGQMDAVATDSGGYLVDRKGGTISQLAPPGKPAAPSVAIRQGIIMAVPGGDSVWVLTRDQQVVEVAGGHAVRTVRLGAPAIGVTVADGHPVAVTNTGKAYVVDSDEPHALGDLGLAGGDVVLGSWRGAGRYVLAVDRTSGKVAALDPRTGRTAHASVPVFTGTKLDAPVELGSDVYVPDYGKPQLWRLDATSGSVRSGALSVPGRPGDHFDLTVSGGHVWANSQYDRRALIVDGDGHDHRADKGAGPDVDDSQSGHEPHPPPSQEPPRTPVAPPAERPDPRPEHVTSPERHRPVERDKVPSVLGMSHGEACKVIRSAGLTCATHTDPAPVTDPDRFGVVSAQSPKAGVRPSARKVTIAYPDHFTMPVVLGQTQGEACSRLRAFTMTCRRTMGAPATGAARPGTVSHQTPDAGTTVTEGATAQIVYYSGVGTTHDYKGQNIDAACGQVEADGFTCVRQEGNTAAGTGQQPNTVYQQTPLPKTRHAIKQPITLTFYSPNNDLPDYRGNTDPNGACADVNARGFVCNLVPQLFPSTNKVEQQDQAPGKQPIGAQVTLRYSPWQLVEFMIYRRNNNAAVWALRPRGAVPPNYGEPSWHVGWGYRIGETIPSPQAINGFSCTAGNGACHGMDQNHFYSRLSTPYGGANWAGPKPAATFMDCSTAPGSKMIYRVWRDEGNIRKYGITDNPAANAWPNNEPLGCVWP